MSRTEVEILFPAQEITLSKGRKVIIEPWGWKVGLRLTPKVISIAMEAMTWRSDFLGAKGQPPGITPDAIVKVIIKYQDEVAAIIQETLGWDDDKMEELQYEDIFTLAQAVLDICIIREGDDDSPLAKMLTLLGLKGQQKKGQETSLQ